MHSAAPHSGMVAPRPPGTEKSMFPQPGLQKAQQRPLLKWKYIPWAEVLTSPVSAATLCWIIVAWNYIKSKAAKGKVSFWKVPDKALQSSQWLHIIGYRHWIHLPQFGTFRVMERNCLPRITHERKVRAWLKDSLEQLQPHNTGPVQEADLQNPLGI